MDWTILVQAGAGGLVVIVVFAFLREQRVTRESFLKTINNHIHENTDVLRDLKEKLAEIGGYLKRNGGR